MSKITLSTIKSFVRKAENLEIKLKSRFSGMTDCVEEQDHEFTPIEKCEDTAYRMGIRGAWFVGGSRDYFTRYETESHLGYKISNSCGAFILAERK